MLKQGLIKYIDILDKLVDGNYSHAQDCAKEGDISTEIAYRNRADAYQNVKEDLQRIMKECEKIENTRHVVINSLYGKTPDFKPGDFTPICDQPFICLKGMRGSGKRYTLFEENLKRLIREVLMENDQNDK